MVWRKWRRRCAAANQANGIVAASWRRRNEIKETAAWRMAASAAAAAGGGGMAWRRKIGMVKRKGAGEAAMAANENSAAANVKMASVAKSKKVAKSAANGAKSVNRNEIGVASAWRKSWRQKRQWQNGNQKRRTRQCYARVAHAHAQRTRGTARSRASAWRIRQHHARRAPRVRTWRRRHMAAMRQCLRWQWHRCSVSGVAWRCIMARVVAHDMRHSRRRPQS